MTALHYAAQSGISACVQSLLKHFKQEDIDKCNSMVGIVITAKKSQLHLGTLGLSQCLVYTWRETQVNALIINIILHADFGLGMQNSK